LKLELVPHPKAPLFANKRKGKKLLADLVKEFPRKLEEDPEGIRETLRQAGFVSLWFFLKFIAGWSNPFDLLNEDLHVEMCNFRQSLLKEGVRGGMFIPRGHYKSTIVTEGGTAWELIRDPNLRIRITNAIASRADDFMHSVKAIFDSNDLIAWLYPECVPEKNAPRWNETEIVLPNRTRKFREPSVEAGGVGGASEGHHYDLHVIDDMVGLKGINAIQGSNVTMHQTRSWFWASEKTLLVSMRRSRVIVVGTRYAVDDVYDDIIKRCYLNVGYTLPYFEPVDRGRWIIYYRKGIEDGKIIFPEEFTQEAYDEMARDDWWTYATQYLNDPQSSETAELSNYQPKRAQMLYDELQEEWFILFARPNKEGEDVDIKTALSETDVVVAADPAGTEKYISSRTSRSASGVLVTTCRREVILIDLRVGFIRTSEFFDNIFAQASKFRKWLRSTFFEANAGFKALANILRDEQEKREKWLGLQPVPAVGDKDVRIRNTLEPILKAGKLYIVDDYYREFNDELRAFPQSLKKDILDMTSLGIMNSSVPPTPEEEMEMAEEEEAWTNRTTNVAGY
jgi:hypothetical protein